MGQRQIDVVASEKDVFPYRDPLKLQFTGLFRYRDEREIGCAAADIDHQHEVALVDTRCRQSE